MTNGQPIQFIADTSAVIQLCRGDEDVARHVRGKHFAITFVTMAELSVGVLKSSKPDATWARIKEILRGQKVRFSSPVTPNIYARLYVDLEKNGMRIPVNDIWIAALAVETGLPVLARDEHFSRIKSLTVINC
jgi:predicted nucleic acid-binding protein